jgi:GH24 family phage-related lysozyme (muramidase)
MSSSCYDANKCSSTKCITNNCISENQKSQLLQSSLTESESCVSSWLTNWNTLHPSAKSALIDMSFNMGCNGIKTFKNFKAALEIKNYTRAIEEMKDSKWCSQVGTRCTRDQICMKEAVDQSSNVSRIVYSISLLLGIFLIVI